MSRRSRDASPLIPPRESQRGENGENCATLLNNNEFVVGRADGRCVVFAVLASFNDARRSAGRRDGTGRDYLACLSTATFATPFATSATLDSPSASSSR